MAAIGIYGDGKVTKKFLNATLDSLKAQADEDGSEFWLVLPFEPVDEGVTDGIYDTFAWATENDVFVRVYSSVEDEEAAKGVDEFEVSENVRASMVKDLIEAEDGLLLVLLKTQDLDEMVDGDEEVIEMITRANENSLPVKQLNNGMIEIDLTSAEEVEDEDGLDEDEVLALGAAADDGDEDAALELERLAEEIGLDLAEEPYASMTWADFAQALCDAAPDEDADPLEEPAADKQPQKYAREDLERKQIRTLKMMATGEGWGNQAQVDFPKWFYVEHLVGGTVPTEAQLLGEDPVPAKPPAGGLAKAPKAPTNGSHADSSADVFEEISESLVKLGELFKKVARQS
jgi:hypothetical protein